MERGKLIIFEGIDHSFKETNAKYLYELLINNGERVKVLSFPNYESEIGKKIYDLLHLNDGVDHKKEISDLCHKEQIDSIVYINNLINKGVTVILDRFFLSNLAYNRCYTVSKVDEFLSEIDIDCIIYMDMLPKLIEDKLKERAKERGEESLDINESNVLFLQDVRDAYLYYLATFGNSLADKIVILKTFKDEYYGGEKFIKSKEELQHCIKILADNLFYRNLKE